MIKVLCQYEIVEDNDKIQLCEEESFSQEILNTTQNYAAIISMDALVKRYYVGAFWIISDKTN